jgi:D-alanyl-D-alanine carboxypeptidase (penicillin-binding protein 5/6)
MFKKLFLILFVSFIYSESTLANLDVKARTAILQDYYSGEILYEKNLIFQYILHQ